jgi:hypothetical protein
VVSLVSFLPTLGPSCTSCSMTDQILSRPVNGKSKILPLVIFGTIVGSLLGALIFWIFFVVCFKLRKRVQGFKQLEDAVPKTSSTRTNGITPFVLPPQVSHNPVHINSKGRVVREVHQPISLVTSLGDTVTHSPTVFNAETQSGDPYSAISSSDLLGRNSGSRKGR